ncbi:MAG: hypothetical protein ACI4SR_07860 [Faecalibacillus sp.]
MRFINDWGFIFMIIMMLPNIIFAYRHPDGFANLYHQPVIEFFEQIGRFGCFSTMIINVPYTCGDWLFSGAKEFYFTVNIICLSLYYLIWIFSQKSLFQALSLSILPSVIFLLSGFLMQSILLIIFSLIFAPCHILISYQNQIKRQQ